MKNNKVNKHIIERTTLFPNYKYQKANRRGKCKPIEYVINDKGCWIIISHCTTVEGYIQCGYIINEKYRHESMHRVSYRIFNGQIPKGMIVRHSCDNKQCINPKHLLIGTHKDNTKDMIDRNRCCCGSQVWSTKLIASQVLRIYSSSKSNKELAEIYNVGYITIWRIKKRLSWKWLTKKGEYHEKIRKQGHDMRYIENEVIP